MIGVGHRKGDTTVGMTQDRRLIIQNTCKHVPAYSKRRSAAMREPVRTYQRRAFLALCPQWVDVPLSHRFGELRPGVFAMVCDNSVGAAWNGRGEL